MLVRVQGHDAFWKTVIVGADCSFCQFYNFSMIHSSVIIIPSANYVSELPKTLCQTWLAYACNHETELSPV